MAYLVKKAGKEDIDLVKRLETASSLSPWTKFDYMAEVERADSIFLVIKGNSELCGFLIARLITNFEITPFESTAEIYNIAVQENRRRYKLGTRLLNSLIAQGRKSNVTNITLEVRNSNIAAIEFYKKNSFAQTGIRKNFYSNPTEHAILMTRRLA